jgi:hypothetical protein
VRTKTHRVLGILWTVVSAFLGIMLAWQLPDFYWLDNYSLAPFSATMTVICLAYLAGTVGGIFLFRGAVWARRFICFIAILSFAICLWIFVASQSCLWFMALFAAFSAASAVILLLTRKLSPNNALQPTATAPSVLTEP